MFSSPTAKKLSCEKKIAVTLPDLPLEIYDHILSYLTQHDFVDLSRSCQKLHQCTLSKLYKSIRWIGDPRPTAAVIYRILRTLTEHPELGPLVRRIDLKCLGDDRDRVSYTSELSTGPKLRLTEEQARRFLYPRDVWENALDRGSLCAYTALILTLTPELRFLRLRGAFIQDPHFIGAIWSPDAWYWRFCRSMPRRLRQPWGNHTPCLTQLRHLNLQLSQFPSDRLFFPHREFQDFLKILYLPKISSIFVGLSGACFVYQFLREPPRLETLTDLRLRSS